MSRQFKFSILISFLILIFLFSIFPKHLTKTEKTDKYKDETVWDNPRNPEDSGEIKVWNKTLTETFNELSMSDDGEYLAVAAGNSVYLFNGTDSDLIWQNTTTSVDISDIDISSNGKCIVASSYKSQKIYFFSIYDSTPVWICNTGRNLIDVVISSNGYYIIAYSDNNNILLFNNSSPEPIWNTTIRNYIISVSMSFNGAYFIINTFHGIELYAKDFFEEVKLLWNYTAPVYYYMDLHAKISENGQKIVSTGVDYEYGQISYFDRSNSNPIWEYPLELYQGFLDISFNGDYLVVTDDSSLLYFEGSSPNPLWNYTHPKSHFFSLVEMTPDGENIVAVNGDDPYRYDQILYFNKTNNQPLWNHTFTASISDIDITSDGKYVVIGDENNTLSFLESSNLPGEFILNTNADDPDTDGAFNLIWEESEDAIYYSIYVYDREITEINESVEERYNQVTSLSILIEEFINGTNFYLVIAYNQFGNTSSNCISVNLGLITGPGELELTSDADNPDEDGAFILDWNAIYGTKNFSVYESDKFINELNGTQPCIKNKLKNTFYSIADKSHGKYFYKVVAFLIDGTNYSSNCINVTVEIFKNGFYEVEPFILDNTGGGDYIWTELLERPWCHGSGSYNNPYIIQNITIDGGNSGSCLEIRNSRVYFVIYNSTFFNSGSGIQDAGIFLKNVTHGKLFQNNCSFNNGNGICFVDSNNNTILENLITNNSYYGIFLDPCLLNTIRFNAVNLNGLCGIFVDDCYNNSIIGNFANNNGFYGIFVKNCSDITISNNIINNNLIGLFLNNSNGNNVTTNNINNNPTGIFLNNSNNNIVTNNIITGYDEGKGIVEFNCTGNIFTSSVSPPILGAGNDDDESGTQKIETYDILIFIVIIGILGFISIAGLLLVKKSRTKLKMREKEIESLKQQKGQTTDEDIKISKEKHFCIVHRGPIAGLNYICPECGTYYCIKCLESIIDIENSCWSCQKPLDPLKVIKKIEDKDEIKIAVENTSTDIKQSHKKSGISKQ